METINVDLLSGATNAVVLRHPDRKFPGILIQGDSLASLYYTAQRIRELASTCDNEELQDQANDLEQELGDLLDHYGRVLLEAGFPLPYVPPRT